MSTLSFHDHQGFHRAAGWMVVAGAGAGTVAGLAGVGVEGALFAGAAGALLGAGWADRAAGRVRLAARAALVPLAALAFVGAREVAGGHVGLAALAVVLGVALNLGVRGWRLAAAAAVGGAIAYVGGFAAGQVMIARETAALPGWGEAALAATAMSIVCVAALLPRHLRLVTDAVAAARRALPADIDGEVRGLLDRGHAVWDQVSPRLDGEGRTLLRDGVLRLYDLAGRWARADRPGETFEALTARVAELDARIAATRDDVARAQYVEARAAVADQLRYVDGIQQSRERVLARLHACVATLEKFRLAAAHLETASASRQATAGGATALLAEVNADIDAAGAALDELAATPGPAEGAA